MLSDFLHYEVAKTGFVVIKFKQSDANNYVTTGDILGRKQMKLYLLKLFSRNGLVL